MTRRDAQLEWSEMKHRVSKLEHQVSKMRAQLKARTLTFAAIGAEVRTLRKRREKRLARNRVLHAERTKGNQATREEHNLARHRSAHGMVVCDWKGKGRCKPY